MLLRFIDVAQVVATAVVPLSKPDRGSAKGKAARKGGKGAFGKNDMAQGGKTRLPTGRKAGPPRGKGKAEQASRPAPIYHYDGGALPKPRFGGSKKGDERGS